MKSVFATAVLLTLLSCAFSQNNFSFTNVRGFQSVYTDISATGTPVTMTNPESGSSIAPINIGFNFDFNGTVFTECMIHADGLLRFGAVAPGRHTSLFTNNSTTSSSVFTNTTSTYQNIVLAFFADLIQGQVAPQFHVLTEGAAPNRNITIQWKNLKDNNNSGSTLQNQFDNLEFQVKLYETSNNIQLVYGNFIVSANTSAGRNAQVGIKAGSTSFIGAKRSLSTTLINATEFFDATAHAIFNASFPFRKAVPVPNGYSFIFYGRRTTDINITEAYVEAVIAKTSAASTVNRVQIKNEGTLALNNIDVNMQISGANSHSQTINVASLAAGANQTIDFTGYTIANTGIQQVQFSATVAGDENLDNNVLSKSQKVSNGFIQPMADSLTQQTGVGFGSSGNEMAIKIFGTGVRKISQVRIPFGSYMKSISLKIMEDDGVGNIPGTVLATSAAVNTNGDNETIFNLATPVTVNGDYYISVRQNSINNMVWIFGLQYPINPNRVFTGNGVTYAVQPTNRAWQGLIKIVEETNLPDMGIAAIVNPACNYSNAAPVSVLLRNYSSNIHDFSVNPVTISGTAVDNITNTVVPFSILRNTGTLAASASETVQVLATYDFSQRATYTFTARTNFAGDAEPQNDSITYHIVSNVHNTKSFTDSICPFTPVTLAVVSDVYGAVTWTVNGFLSGGNSRTFTPSQTTTVFVTAVDYRGCTLSDSIIVPVRANGLPPTPVISYNDTLLSFRNQFSDTLSVPALAGHTVNWLGSGNVINGGLGYRVAGFQGTNPSTHQVYYRNTNEACGSNPATITTRFANGILLNNNNTQVVCDTSFYDSGGGFGTYATSDFFTKTFLPETPGKKIKLSFYGISLGQFSNMQVYDGDNLGTARIGFFNNSSFITEPIEFTASSGSGAITIRFSANGNSGAGWLAGIRCVDPLQFRTVQNGLYSSAANWESKLPSEPNYSPASRAPNKGDDTIIIRHAINLPANMNLPIDQTIIEPTGLLTVPSTSNLIAYSENGGYDINVEGTLEINGAVFGGVSSSNGKIKLKGTLNLTGQIIIDSVIAGPAASAAIINGNGRIYKLQVNNPNGVNQNGNIDIVRALDLKNGLLNISPGNYIRLVSGEGPVMAGGSTFSYINGKVRWQTFMTNDPLVFHIGKNNIYRKIELLPNQSSPDFFVEYEAELFTGPPTVRNFPSGITSVNQNWYHHLSIVSGASFFNDATVTLYYQAADGIADPNVLRIAKDDGGSNWLNIGGTGSGSPAGSITSNSFTSFSDFVLANITGGPLPVNLLSFTGKAAGKDVVLSWRVTNEQRFAGYYIERSVDGINFSSIGFAIATGTVNTTQYNFTDVQVPAQKRVYYRLRMTDIDGRFTLSNIVNISFGNDADMVNIYPVPAHNNLFIAFKNQQKKIQTSIFNASGGLVMQHLFTNTNFIQIDVRKFPPGVYWIKFEEESGNYSSSFIKQ